MSKSIKETILNLLEEEEDKKTVALYGGGFKPPTKGHFAVVNQALDEEPDIDELIIYIGKLTLDTITQDQSLKAWEIYAKHLPFKVKFENVSSPIGSIYDYAKEHPEENILWIIGAREGNDEDFKDISQRTKNLSKYPNIELKTIITSQQVSGTAARTALAHSSEKFNDFLPDLLSAEEKSEFFSIFQNQGVTENLQDVEIKKIDLYSLAEKYSVGLYTIIQKLLDGAKAEFKSTNDGDIAMEQSFNMLSKDLNYYDKLNIGEVLSSYEIEKDDITPHIAPLTKFMEQNGLIFEPYPKLQIIPDDVENSEGITGNTAYYDPNNNEMTLYTYNRHPKDVLRSYAHELIHVYQDRENRLDGLKNTTNVEEDENLEQIEKEAYEKGNILFRKYINNLNEGKRRIDFEGLEKELDDMFDDLDIDINFTNHFKQRVLQRKVTEEDVVDLMKKIHDKYGKELQRVPNKHRRVLKHMTRNVDIVAAADDSWDGDKEKDIVFVTAFKKGPEGGEITNPKKDPVYKVTEKRIKKDPFGLNAYTMELARLTKIDEEKYNVYLDMDGVIADFDSRFEQLSGLLPPGFLKEHGEDKFWKLIDTTHKVKFWVGIPIMEGAKQLVNYLESKTGFELLTAPSREKASYLGKRIWVKNKVGELFSKYPKINFKAAFEKHEIKPELTEKDILIDDREKIIKKWEKKGGIGIHHTSSSNTINELKKLGI